MDRPWYAFYDEGVPREVEYPEVPLYELMRRTAEAGPNKQAIDFLGRRMSYGQLWEETRRFARALQDLGVQPGDRVAIMLPNSPQFVVAFYGTLLAGAVAVNTNPLYTPRELSHQLRDSGAETLVILDLLWPRYEEVAGEVPVKRVVTTGIQDYLPFPKNWLFPLKAKKEGTWVHLPQRPERHDWRSVLKAPPEPAPRKVGADDLALLQYTGGTTGVSKGAMLSHRNLISNVYQIDAWEPGQVWKNGVMLGVIPFFHVYGMTVSMNYSVMRGMKMVLLPRFDIAEVVAAIEKHGVTHFPGVPTMYVAFNTFPGIENRNIRTIKVCLSGAAPLPVEVATKFEELTGAKLVEGYGLTEAAPVTHCNPLYGKRKVGSIGLPFPSVDAMAVDPEGNPLPPGEVGELAVKGPNVMMGYWNRPEETAQTLKDGWLFTGDVARMDEEGYFYIVDRKKDMIIAGGYNIYPREVEEVLYQHPAVKEAAVVGVPDAYRGETVKAFVVLKEGYEGQVDEEELRAFAKERLAAYKVPKLWEFREELPKTAVGKILRRMLRKEEEEKQRSAR